MKAAQISDYGDPSVIQVNEVEQPRVSEGKVLVEVHASSLNPFDSMVRAGYLKEAMPLELPATLGGDIAGIVSQLGEGVTHLAVGDRVYGQAAVVAGNSGAFAEYAVTSAGQLAKAPEGLDFIQAASLPLTGVSAWQALVKHIGLQPGQKIFIHGGAGGIGTLAIQIAKQIGAYVATTATGDHVEAVKALGADEVIDYKSQDFTTLLKDYDAAFDTVGGDDFNRILDILKPGATADSMIAQADEAKASVRGIRVLTQSTQVTTEALDALRGLVESGAVKPQVDKVFPLDQVSQAFEARENGPVQGKIVISIR